jgi:predicted DsbA family dithiol-disulfide isomerase
MVVSAAKWTPINDSEESMNSTKLANLLTGVLTFCAVIITALVIRREFFPKEEVQNALPKPRIIKDWEQLGRRGNLLGSPSAPIRIVTFSDYQCPFCRELDSSLTELRGKYQNQIAVLYRHDPLTIHREAFSAAVAAECAANQGEFAPYHALLFHLQDSIGKISFQDFARRAGVPDSALFRRCNDDMGIKDRVRQDAKEAERIGVRGTPAMIIRNELLGGSIPADSIAVWIRRVEPNVLVSLAALK